MRLVDIFIVILVPVFLNAFNIAFAKERKFSIDYENNTFLMDGLPFRYVSGSFHYFRALPETWHYHLKTMRAGGLNAIQTYVEWFTHNPRDGVYKWDGIANLVQFLQLTQAEGFYVILRIGPFIAAERDNGGLPYWLFTKYPNIKLRTSDQNFTNEVSKWYEQLMPLIQPFLYGNGGHIIMLQIENEYGSYYACDHKYLNWLRNETEKYVQGKAVLFTTDAVDKRIQCGKIDGVFITTDFGLGDENDLDIIWRNLTAVQPKGPKVNSEFYSGWFTLWQHHFQRGDVSRVSKFFKKILESGANINIYMYFGGTNFGFNTGSGNFDYGNYASVITSYDYDAILDESGGLTPKFFIFRDIIKEFIPTRPSNVPPPIPRIFFENVTLVPSFDLFSANGCRLLAKNEKRFSKRPLMFEELDQFSGLVLYETMLPKRRIDPTLLTVNELRDRALVYVDKKFVGLLSRQNAIYSLPLSANCGDTLQIIVENQGRNYDTKGIIGNVTIQGYNGERITLEDWYNTGFSLDEKDIKQLADNIILYVEKSKSLNDKNDLKEQLVNGPRLYYGEFNVTELGDTYLNTRGWGKGVAFVNEFNLGRYWPLAGPQITLYVPNAALKIGKNYIFLLEYQNVNLQEIHGNKTAVVNFDDHPQLDGWFEECN